MVENSNDLAEIPGARANSPLSSPNLDLAREIFTLIDSDQNQIITESEVLDWWKNNFAKINARNFFKDLDRDSSNGISLDEWLGYWQKFKDLGNSEEDITEELEFLKEKGPWATC